MIERKFLSVRHAASVMCGREVVNGDGRKARVLAASIKVDGSLDELFIRDGEQEPEWVEASKWTVVN